MEKEVEKKENLESISIDEIFNDVFYSKDSFRNDLMGISNSDVNIEFGEWETNYQQMLSWSIYNTIYDSSWVARTAINKISSNMVSDLVVNTQEEPHKIEKFIKEFNKHKKELIQLLRETLKFGGAVSAMIIDGHLSNTEEPLNVSSIKKGSKLSLYTRDRWIGLEPSQEQTGYEALGTSDFLKPKYYKFNFLNENKEDDSIKFHCSYVLRCENRQASNYTKKIVHGWGVPELFHVLTELKRNETIKGATAKLITKCLIEIIKTHGMRGLSSGLDGSSNKNALRKEIENRIAAVTKLRNINNISFMDVNDEYQQFQFQNFTGLADVFDRQRRETCGAFEIPEIIVYGGVDNTGIVFQKDGSYSPEIEVYNLSLQSRRTETLHAVVDKFFPILWRIANGEDLPEDFTYEFLSPFKESEASKLERTNMVINASEKLFRLGVYSSKDIAKEVRQYSKQTGFGTNITNDIIESLSDERKSDRGNENNAQNNDISEENDKETLKIQSKVAKKQFNNIRKGKGKGG